MHHNQANQNILRNDFDLSGLMLVGACHVGMSFAKQPAARVRGEPKLGRNVVVLPLGARRSRGKPFTAKRKFAVDGFLFPPVYFR